MDPLSVAMSIVGLLKAAEQISSTLQPLIKKAANAPKEIKDMKSSVDVIRTVLSQLQLMLLGQSSVSRHRTSLILVEQIVITLSACVTTFSDLDVFVETLGTDAKMGLLDRMRWATKASTIQEHLEKLEVHKSTLTLMITILTCDSTRTAEDAVDVLSSTIQCLLDSNLVIAQRLASIEVGLGVTTEIQPFAEFETLNPVPGPVQRNSQGFAFEEELSHSWVYKRSAVRDNNGAFSVMTSAGKTASWSMLSGLSLADNISMIAVQALPVYEEDLSNSDLYKFGDFTESQLIFNGSSKNHTAQSTGSDKVASPSRKSLRSWWKTVTRNPANGSAVPEDTPRIFGVALTQSMVYANVAISLFDAEGNSHIYGYVPIVVAAVCVFLKEKGTQCEDIFARSGSPTRVHKLETIFDSPDQYGRGHSWVGYSVHDAAACLLRYLKRLPEPIIPYNYFDKFISLLIIPDNFIGSDAFPEPGNEAWQYSMAYAIPIMQQYITELAPLSQQLLLYLFDTLIVFTYCSDKNKMTTPRIIAAFQPSFLAREPSVGMSADDHRRAALTLVFMVDNQDHFVIGMHGTDVYKTEIQKALTI